MMTMADGNLHFSARSVVLLLGWAGLMAPMAWGQSSPPTSVAVIDIAKVFEQYQMTTDLNDFFEKQKLAVSEQRDTRRKELETRRKELEAFVADTTDYKERSNELMRLEVEYQVWLELQERLLKDEHMRRLRQIYDDVRAMVKSVCESSGIELMLTYDTLSGDAADSAALRQQILLQKVIYVADRIELTEEVLKALNESYSKRGGIGSLKLGAAPPAEETKDLPTETLAVASADEKS